MELIYDDGRNDAIMAQDISIGFGVESLDAMMGHVKKKSLQIHSGPFQPNPNTSFFFVLDPNGLKVQFIENI